jgi:membrane protein involved in colicin uptake
MTQRDAEIDRLKSDQDRAFQQKQDAWRAQDQAWNRRQAARDTMDRAYAAKQEEYENQNAAWQDLQQVRDYNGPRIESLNSQQETAYDNMRNAFDNASSAHESRDGASARAYADDGHAYKAEAQEAVAERRQLVDEIREARARHEAIKPDFQRAKADFDRARDEHNRAKAEHEGARDEFKRAKADFDRAKNAFQARLEVVRADRQQRKNDKRSVAERAGVPYQYLDELWVSTDPDGSVNIYFGGVGEPNGPGHGHYSMDSSGNVTYQRDPFDPHGAENFADYEERQAATMYDRSVSSESPAGARGSYNLRGDRRGHSTQYYPDGTRKSWDTDGTGDNQNEHWTDQNVPKGRRGRHNPPPHAQ